MKRRGFIQAMLGAVGLALVPKVVAAPVEDETFVMICHPDREPYLVGRLREPCVDRWPQALVFVDEPRPGWTRVMVGGIKDEPEALRYAKEIAVDLMQNRLNG